MNTTNFPENYPDDCLKLTQTKLNQKGIKTGTLINFSDTIYKAATANPEAIEQVSDTYAQIMKHPSCDAETIEEVCSGLSEIIKKHPNKAAKPLNTYNTAMHHPQNDEESEEWAQRHLSAIARDCPNCTVSIQKILQTKENTLPLSKQGGNTY